MKQLLLLMSLCWLGCSSALAVELGFSGMTQVNDHAYLVVLDKKVFHKGERVGVLNITKKGKQKFTPVSIDDWRDDDGQASDLESVCKLPQADDEYLLAESGYWNGKFGRIFHIQLQQQQAKVLHVYHLPKYVSNSEPVDGDNFEGLACIANGQQTFVVLGERGGSALYPSGLLRFGVMDAQSADIDWQTYADKALTVSAPGQWHNAKGKRSISDLYLDPQGTLWTVATEDAGDQGPFRSLIYAAAQLVEPTNAQPLPLKITHQPQAQWQIDGFKVESLAAPTTRISHSVMSFGTEDEDYGGVWRVLFAPVNNLAN
ncbi:esterase-like activity of phytase family protein [Shewanella sp.]|uniref:esterase-like activity of phytase family protein n=1 Tax=Shewanella sp. TaxID=50422 RepID=UPI003A986976